MPGCRPSKQAIRWINPVNPLERVWKLVLTESTLRSEFRLQAVLASIRLKAGL